MDEEQLNGSEIASQPAAANHAFVQLPVGTVIRAHVVDTNPPKVKRFVIVGYYQSEAITVYFNSTVNEFYNYSTELQDLHLPFDPDASRPYIAHKCFCDCSQLKKKNSAELHAAIQNNPGLNIGRLSDDDWAMVKAKLAGSPNIKGTFKNRYGFYD